MNLNITAFLSKMAIGLTLLYVGLVFSQVTSPDAGSSDCVCEEPMNNVWYKLSTGEDGIQRTIKLNMQKGKSYSDGPYYVLELRDADNGDIIFVAFPIMGPWEGETPKDKDPFLEALDEEFKNLEDYLKSKQSEEIEKNY